MTIAEPPEPATSLPLEQRSRAEMYFLQARVLAAPPDHALLDLIGEMSDGDKPGQDSVQDALQSLGRMAKQSVPAQLEDEFFALFIGLGRGELVPYASWYLTGYLMEQPLASLRSELCRLGYERQKDVVEPEDHVAALCEVMGMIVSESVLSFEEQRAFYVTFIEPWFERFFADVVQAEAAHFYKAAGTLGQRFFAIESRYFSMPA